MTSESQTNIGAQQDCSLDWIFTYHANILICPPQKKKDPINGYICVKK